MLISSLIFNALTHSIYSFGLNDALKPVPGHAGIDPRALAHGAAASVAGQAGGLIPAGAADALSKARDVHAAVPPLAASVPVIQLAIPAAPAAHP